MNYVVLFPRESKVQGGESLLDQDCDSEQTPIRQMYGQVARLHMRSQLTHLQFRRSRTEASDLGSPQWFSCLA